MGPITLELPPELEKALEERSTREHRTVGDTLVAVLSEALCQPKELAGNRAIDKLFGIWTEEDFREFERATADTRAIDPEAWR